MLCHSHLFREKKNTVAFFHPPKSNNLTGGHPFLFACSPREREEARRKQAEQREAAKEFKRLEKLRAREELKNMRVEVGRA